MPCSNGCNCRYDTERSVNVFNCSYTCMKSLPTEIEVGTDSVNFSHNNISSITFYPSYIDNMRYMDISFSGLQSIHESFFLHLANRSIMRKLNLASNGLKSLPNTITKLHLDALSIGDNPYHCDCSIMWMRDWLLQLSTLNNSDYTNAVCKSGSMIDTPIYLLDSSHMGCGDQFNIWFPVVLIGGILIVIVIIAALLIKYSGAIAFFLYLRFDILIGSDGVMEDIENMEFDAFVTYR